MKIRVIGSTCGSQDEALKFCGRAAGVCYMPNDFDAILAEPEEKTLARAKNTLASGHHSVYDHVTYNLLIEDIPKILAMILNNEGWYTTSEKSARYTQMKGNDDEMKLYRKWQIKLYDLIEEKYGEEFLKFYGSEKKTIKAIEKLAMENARYMLSVFTYTTMVYTVSLRQINYILGYFQKFSDEMPKMNIFYDTIRLAMLEFKSALPKELIIPELNAHAKGKGFSMFRKNTECEEYFGEVYNISYLGSWAEFAQAQRHRTLSYQMSLYEDFVPVIPPIIPEDMVDEWVEDMRSVAYLYPQGMAIRIYESGRYDKFLLKCYERMCGCAQLEIAKQTAQTLRRYHNARPDLIPNEYMNGARCTFPCFKCTNRCVWGAKNALDRLV